MDLRFVSVTPWLSMVASRITPNILDSALASALFKSFTNLRPELLPLYKRNDPFPKPFIKLLTLSALLHKDHLDEAICRFFGFCFQLLLIFFVFLLQEKLLFSLVHALIKPCTYLGLSFCFLQHVFIIFHPTAVRQFF
jgi:hypothetical protein